MIRRWFWGLIGCWLACGAAAAQESTFAAVSRQVNQKMVKIFGAGGYRGITAYCTGVLISPEGDILTVYSPTLDSVDLRVHLYDGTRHSAVLVAAEPQLDVALIRIKDREPFKLQPLPHVDLGQLPPPPQVGDWILAFSNSFEIATGDEPVSVQRGVIAAITPFAGRRGIHRAAYQGTAYILDAVTNNPGAQGGLITNRRGEPLALIGKELKNTLTETWVNYAMPLPALASFAAKAMKGEYKPIVREEDKPLPNPGRHGLILVPDVVDRTPPFVESVETGSPAAQAGFQPDDLILFLRAKRPDAVEEEEEQVVTSVKTFREAMNALPPGTAVRCVVRRGSQLLTLEFKLEPAR